MKSVLSFFLTSTILLTQSLASEPIDIGNRLELFVDDYLIEKIEGNVGHHMMLPEPQEVVFVVDESWEGNTSAYYSIFQDGDSYKMVYRGWQHDQNLKEVHKAVTCYAESDDGIHWRKPKLGLFEWEGSNENNIIWMGPGSHNFTAFRDHNPKTPRNARYRALSSVGNTASIVNGLLSFQSPDCLHWTYKDEPVITNGAFDSQNLAFWDTHRQEYRAYWRFFTEDTRIRAIRTATSKDFVHWENEADLQYGDAPEQHLYTNAVQKYARAPHLFIGFPTRFLPDEGDRVEPVLMTSRDGVHFKRWNEPVIPETAPKDRKGNRSNYMAWGMLQLPGKPDEISVFATENYKSTTPGRLRRFTYRVDGFVALRGNKAGGIVSTKPLQYKGDQLLLNYLVRDGGSLIVEAYDEKGKLIGRSAPLSGDAYDQSVKWKKRPRLSEGTVTLRFNLRNADLYSMRFK